MYSMKRFIDGFIILWNDERGKALIKLCIYIIFIVFVVLYARSLNSKDFDNREDNKVNLDSSIEQRNYLADINIDDIYISLTGGEIISFDYNNYQYTVVDSKLMKNGVESDDFEVYFWKFNPNFVSQLLEEREPEYTSNFKDGSMKKGYIISLFDFVKEFQGSKFNVDDTEFIPNENIDIIIEYSDSKIKNISLNLDNYYKLVTNENKSFDVLLKY